MNRFSLRIVPVSMGLLLMCVWSGCGSDAPTPPVTSPSTTTSAAPAGEANPASTNPVPPSAATPAGNATTTAAPKPAAPMPIRLGGGQPSGSGAGSTTTGSQPTEASDKAAREQTLVALQPLQVLRDEWQVNQRSRAGTEDAVQDQNWIWDFKTDRSRPALVMASTKGDLIRQARLTYNPNDQKYLLEATTPAGDVRKLEGEFTQEVAEEQGDDNKIHRTYKLQFTQVEPADARDALQIVINQQTNNRYLMEISKKKGTSFVRVDTLAAQRMGTSFALSDTEYGERTCVVSAGLGTTAVTYMGRTFYVCCSGCQSAFNDDPATWVAEFEAKQKAANP